MQEENRHHFNEFLYFFLVLFFVDLFIMKTVLLVNNQVLMVF